MKKDFNKKSDGRVKQQGFGKKTFISAGKGALRSTTRIVINANSAARLERRNNPLRFFFL